MSIVGSFVSTGAARIIDLPTGFDYIEIFNQTQQGSSANPGVVKRAVYFSGMASGSALVVKNTDGAATDASSLITSGGFTPVDSASDEDGAFQTITSVSLASSAVVTVTAHGYATGDIVRFTNVTGMQQISGYAFQITVTGANTFTIPLDTSGFATAGSGGSVQKLALSSLFIPANVAITAITRATSAVVSTSIPHNLSVGAFVSFRVPSAYGMTQMDGVVGQVTAVGSALSYTVDVDSSAFTAFAFPTSVSVSAQAVTPAQGLPLGEQQLLDNVTYNVGQIGVQLGTSVVGASGDVIRYIVVKASN